MIINHNLQSMNAHRNMGVNQTNAQKSMEKLSSGLRINRAGDDAAGLSISEKMRGQIRGLNQASRNAQDGISLIQTAEGALDETHAILQRMRELTVQGANDTNVEEDRNAIKEELGQLTTELDRIANTTEFNKQNLLAGGFDGTFQIGANTNQTIDVKIGAMGSNALGLSSGTKIDTAVTKTAGTGSLQDGTYTISGTSVKDHNGNEVGKISDATKGEITLADGTTKIELGHKVGTSGNFDLSGNKAKITLTQSATAAAGFDALPLDKLAAGDYKVSGTNLLLGDTLVGTLDGTNASKLTLTDGTKLDLKDIGLIDADLADGKTFTISGVDVSTADKATGSIKTLDKALEKVSAQRSSLGAVQNRLEHTIKNLNNASENTQAAESRIRDVDMAKEMMEMSKNNILNQAAQAMLAQANQNPQQVLQLLR